MEEAVSCPFLGDRDWGLGTMARVESREREATQSLPRTGLASKEVKTGTS